MPPLPFPHWALALGMLFAVGVVHAGERPLQFRLCSMDVDFAPFAKIDGSGHVQYLVAEAAKALNVTVDRRVAPRKRCIEEIKTGQSDGMIAAYSPERASYAAFPMRAGGPDESKSLAVVRYFAYRRVGSRLEWDGQRFTGLGTGTLGVESGFILITERLRQLGVPFDEGGKSLLQNMEKLVADRFDGIVAMDLEADRQILERFAGKVERAGKPFEQTPLYLMVSKQFDEQNPTFMVEYWRAIEAFRTSATYRKYQQDNP